MDVPIACSLEPGDARSQLAEWRTVLDRVVERSERTSPNRLEFALSPASDISPVIALARREAVCCPFFSFTVEIGAGRLVLAVQVPDDAVGVLDGFAAGTR